MSVYYFFRPQSLAKVHGTTSKANPGPEVTSSCDETRYRRHEEEEGDNDDDLDHGNDGVDAVDGGDDDGDV